MSQKSLFLIFFLGSCAHGLKTESDIAVAPEDFVQKIESIDGSKSVEQGVNGALSAEESQVVHLKKLLGQVKTSEGSAASIDKVAVTPSDASVTKAPLPLMDKAKVDSKKKTKKGAAVAVDVQSPAVPTWKPLGWPYGIGEKVTMGLRYGVLEGGVATLEVLDFQKVNNEPVIHYQGKVRSSKVLDFFYKVDDVMDSWVGLHDHLPRRQEIKQLESNRWGRRVVVFDPQKQKAKFYAHATFQNGKVEEIKKDATVAAFAQDVFGALFFYRFIPMGEGRVNFSIHDRFRNWSNEFTFLGREKIRVPLGEFDTLHYKMFPRVSGDLAPKGDVEIWVSDDSRRLMLKFKAKIKVGSITGEVREYVPGTPITMDPPVMKTATNLPGEVQNK